MRGALLALLVIAAVAVLVPASVADSPARARAQASVVAGSLGDFGTLVARLREEGALGARLTGGGFGGSVVALFAG